MTETKTPEVRDNGTAPHASLAEALAAFQAELPKLTKDEKAKVKGETKDGRSYDRSYGYADLAQVVETVLPVLGKHGLSVTSATTLEEGQMVLVVTLLHESGELRTSYWPLPDPRRSGPQDIGSAMTYGRRYLTLALTGTYPGGEDDDGKQAQQTARERWEDANPVRRPVEDRQAQSGEEPQAAPAPPKPVKTSWTDEEVGDYQIRLTQVDLAQAGAAYDWMAARDLHNRGVGASGVTATLVLALRLADTALTPEATPDEIHGMKVLAESRGLMKVKVSPTETLEEALFTAHELATHATEQAQADTPDPGGE